MEIVARAVFMYLLLLVVLRITTRRVMRSATPLDMVLVFVFGGIAIQAIVGDDRSLTTAVVAICTFAGTHLAISFAKLRWRSIGRLVEGPPVILYSKGQWQHDRLRQMRMQEEDVFSELRQRGLRSLDEVELVVLEHNGGVSIIEKRPG